MLPERVTQFSTCKSFFSSSSSINCRSPISVQTIASLSQFQQSFIHSIKVQSNFRQTQKLFSSIEINANLIGKYNRKIVSWLATICWSKSLSDECFWLSTILFYICKSRIVLNSESSLETVVLTCLHIASKMYQKAPFSLIHAQESCQYPIMKYAFIEMESRILEEIGFNLHFEIPLHHFLWNKELQEEDKWKKLFICDLYLMKSYQILFDEERLNRIAMGCFDQDAEEINELAKFRESKILRNKYYSKFDVELFLITLK